MKNRRSKNTHIVLSADSAESVRDARARAWRYVFDCYANRKAADVTSIDGDDTKERSDLNDFRAPASIQE